MQFQNKLIVFPTSRAIREFVSTQNTNSLLPKLTTIGDFFQNAFYCDFKICPDEIRQKFLAASINSTNAKKLGVSTKYTIFQSQSDYIFKFFEELANEKIELSQLQTSDTYAMYEDHLSILAEILKNYLDLLEQNCFVDKITYPKKYKINNFYIEQFCNIEIVLEGYLSKFEFDSLVEISKIVTVLIRLRSTKYNVKNLEKFAFFGPFEENTEYLLDLTNYKIISSSKMQKNNFSLTISPVESRFEQIEFINFAIYSMLQQNIDPKKICVVLPDESFAQELIVHDNEKKMNFAMGYSFVNIYFYQKFKAFCEALTDEKDPKISQKISYFSLESEFFNNSRKTKKLKATTIFLENLRDFFSNDIAEEIAEKIDFVFYYYQNLLKMGVDFSNLELLRSMSVKFGELFLDYIDGGEVTVLGILEVRDIVFDGVIIVDFNDSKLPKSSVKDKFISTRVKKFANLTTSIDRNQLQKYYYNSLLFNAKMVFVSYVLSDQDNISTFSLELFGKTKLEKSTKFFKFENLKLAKHKNEPIYFVFTPNHISWSAYKLRDFLICKKRFFLKYIMKVDEPANDLYDANKKDIGVLVHKVLQLTFEDPNYKSDLNKTIKKYFSQIKQENPVMIFELSVWQHKLEDFAQYEIQRLNNGAEIVALESRFDTKINGINFVGVIDRIDKIGDAYHLIDYKTGKIAQNDENDFQLEIYALAKKELNCKTFIYDLKNTKLQEKILDDQSLNNFFETLEILKQPIEVFEPTQKVSDCLFCLYKTICGADK